MGYELTHDLSTVSTHDRAASADAQRGSKAALWTGRVLSGLAVAFLAFDGIMKLPGFKFIIEASAQVGIPAHVLPFIGSVLLVSTILYAVPRTSALGAVLLTGYLGGAFLTNLRIDAPAFNLIFPFIVGAFVWGGLFLRDARLRVFLPWGRS